MRVAAQPVQAGDDERGAMDPARLQGCGELGPVVVAFAALDLNVLAEELPVAAVQVVLDGAALGLDAEAGSALALGRDAQIADELALVFDHGGGALPANGVVEIPRNARLGVLQGHKTAGDK